MGAGEHRRAPAEARQVLRQFGRSLRGDVAHGREVAGDQEDVAHGSPPLGRREAAGQLVGDSGDVEIFLDLPPAATAYLLAQP